MSASVFRRLDRYFFASQNLLPVAMLRIVLVIYLLPRFYSIPEQISFSDVSFIRLHEPSPLIEQLRHLLFSAWDPSVVTGIYIAAGICSIIGLFTRISLFVFGIITLFVTGIKTSLGIFWHDASLTSQVLLVLAFIPGSTSLTVDRLMISWRRRLRGQKITLREALFAGKQSVWGVRLLLILIATVYFTAGVSKIRYGGVQWVNGKTLQHYLDGSASPVKTGSSRPQYIGATEVSKSEAWKDGYGLYSYSYGNRQFSPTMRRVGEIISGFPFIMITLSLMTLLWELSGFSVLFDRTPRTVYLLVSILMHFSIGLLMNLPFNQFRIICFFLLDWNWIFLYVSRFFKDRLPAFRLAIART